ncbi:acetate--CoA ligase family protein [Candidatus Marsarchaeota archaeon]|jgi:succinyl-CoA synthetase beta subunit|nr:acetate--CoA ligase family protein [Candidatus Marsarchaeota archaeon]MCL5089986.1 acetate--CoA ligase family protein [Candidatus Marsarchaeota archaeon]
MKLMDYIEAHALLEKYKIKSIESRYISNSGEAIKFSDGKPIVMKALSDKALHKTKSGLVALNINGENQIKKTFESLKEKAAKYKPYKMIIQKMIQHNSENKEIIVGGREDPQFGKLVLIGLGGIYVEAFKDFSLRVCPISKNDAEAMIGELKSKDIIAKTEEEKKMLEEILLKTSSMLVNNDIKELDLNPIILHDGTYHAVDIRILK